MAITTKTAAPAAKPQTYAQQLARQIAESSISGSGNFFKYPGRGVAVLDRLYGAVGFKGGRIQGDFTIESNLPTGANAPNTSATVIFKVGEADQRKRAMHMGKAKALVLALAGARESDVSAEELDNEIGSVVVEQGQETPRKGTRLGFEVIQTTTGAGVLIDVVNFHPLAE